METPRPVALITGAARRIGAEIARELHTTHDLTLHYRSSGADMEALAAALDAERSGSVLALQADLADTAALPKLVSKTVTRFGRLDVLVNNASSYYATPIGETTLAQWDELFASNARGPFFLSQSAAPQLAKQSGCILNIVDIYAERPLRGHAVYSMAKAALAMMTKALAVELGPDVRVNGIAPGNILWSDNPVKAETLDIVRARTTLARQGEPADIARAVRQLIESPYLSGQIIAVDGGRSLFI